MTEIGRIVRLQVQVASLKVGERPHRRYDLGGLRAVPALAVEAGGVVGLDPGRPPVMDVHHRDHPAAKFREADGNGLSLGFTSHYVAIRRRFGPHLADGEAAENILVATDRPWTERDLAGGLVIATAAGERVRLGRVNVATPCVEFARFALRFPAAARPDPTVTDALVFLNGGMRGYYATLSGETVRVEVGDRVLLGV